MECREFQSRIMDWLYDEIEDGPATAAMAEHAASCAACGAKAAEFRGARDFLAAWEEEVPDACWVAPSRRPETAPRSRGRWRGRAWLTAAAMFFAIAMAGLLFMKSSIRIVNGGVEIRVGWSDTGKAKSEEEEVKKIVTSLEDARMQQAYLVVNQMIAESEERQMQKTLDLLQNLYATIGAGQNGKNGAAPAGSRVGDPAPGSRRYWRLLSGAAVAPAKGSNPRNEVW